MRKVRRLDERGLGGGGGWVRVEGAGVIESPWAARCDYTEIAPAVPPLIR